MRKARLVFFIVLSLTACQTSVSQEEVPCLESSGSTELIQLGEEDVGDAAPYTINVYLPPCYQSEISRRYPILYLFPGRGGGATAWFEAGLPEIVDQMLIDNGLSPMIIVALAESDQQGTTFIENIYPYAEHEYRILEGAEFHSIGGASMGATPAYRLVFQYPERFGSTALFGGGFIAGEEDKVREWLSAIPQDQLPRVFLNTGQQDDVLSRTEKVAEVVSEFGIEPYGIYTDGGHSYQYWISKFSVYLKWLEEGW